MSQGSKSKLTRRQFVYGTALLTAGSALAACAPKATPAPAAADTPVAPAAADTPVATAVPAPKEPVKLVQMNWGTATRPQNRDAALRRVFPELETTTVEFEVVDSTPEALRLRLAAGTGIPDMIRFDVEHTPEFVHSGELLDVSDYFAPVEDDLYGGAKVVSFVEGRYVTFPCWVKSKMFWYREDLYQEAGIDGAAIASFQDFIDAGKALQQKFPKSHIINFGPQPGTDWIDPVISAYPETLFADANGKFLVDSLQPFKDCFQMMKEITDAAIALPIDDWSSDWEQAFADEGIVGSLCANWMKLFIPGFAPLQSGKWKGVLWPTLDPYGDQRYGSTKGGGGYSVPKRCPHPQEAAEYLRMAWLTPEGCMATFRADGLVPLLKSLREETLEADRSPVRPEGMSDGDWAALPSNYFGPNALEVEFQSYDFVRVVPYDPSIQKEYTILHGWLVKYLADEVGLDEALAKARQDMESQIGNPYDI